MIAVFDATAAAHLRRALDLYARRLRSDGLQLPEALLAMVQALDDASGRQPAPKPFAPVLEEDDGAMATALLTYEEAAQRLRCSERTVDRLVAGGDLKTVAIGKLRRIHVADLAEYVDSLRVGAPQGAA